MPRRRLLLHHHQTAYEPETLELPEEVVIPKKNAPSVNGTLRQTALRVPEVTWQCSGIMVFGKKIRSLVFSTEFRDYGIEVLAIETKRIDLPDENKAAVYERMISERGNIAASYEAQGNAEAKRIRNEADKTVDITISEANSQSEKLKAAGEAEYMRILSEVYDTPEEADFYEFMRALDMAQKALVGGNKTLVVSSDSPIAKIFSGQWGQAE